MTDCPLIQLDNGKWHCPVCDPQKKRLLPVKARRNCRKNGQPYRTQRTVDIKREDIQPAADKLGIEPKHVKHYAQALVRYIAAGRPKRSDEEIEACLAACKACKNYTKNGRCRKCGCGVNSSKIAMVNKARMATESCMLGKWPGDKIIAPAARQFDGGTPQ